MDRLTRHSRETEDLHEALSELPDFWQALYGDGRGFLALFSAHRRTPDAELSHVRELYLPWSSHGAAQAQEWIAEEISRGRELYQCAHLTTAWRRRKDTAAPFHTLYADVDRATIIQSSVMPSVVVESSPQRFQAYVRLSTPVTPQEGTHLNRRLATAWGADMSGADATQLLRVPGSVNHKYPDHPPVRLRRLSPRVYNPDELDQLLPQVPHRTAAAHGTLEVPEPQTAPPIPLSRLATKIWNGEEVKLTPDGLVDRSASLVKIARLLFDTGLTREQLVLILAERDATLGWHKYTARPDSRAQYARIVDILEQSGRRRR